MSEQPQPMIGFYVEGEADGAIRNGSRVVKCDSEPGDGHPDGTVGSVISSLAVPNHMRHEYGADYFYWVEWESDPGMAVGVLDRKVRAA
jgi:hypothetical protein